MKKTGKAIIVAIVLLILGIIVSTAALVLIDFDFSKLNTEKYVSKIYYEDSAVSDIAIDVCDYDVVIKKSEDGKFCVKCTGKEKTLPSVSVADGKLSVVQKNNIDFGINFNFESEKVEIYLPDETCKSINAKISSGNFTAKSLSVENEISIKTSSGEITLEGCDAKTFDLCATSGDIKAELMTEKTVSATSASGEIKVPSNVPDGECKVKTTSGDIFVNYK